MELLPFIIAIFIGIEALVSSGAMQFLETALGPVFRFFGIPKELVSLVLLRPVSGSGSLVLVGKNHQTVRTGQFCGKVCISYGGQLRDGFLCVGCLFRSHISQKNQACFLRWNHRLPCRHFRVAFGLYVYLILQQGIIERREKEVLQEYVFCPPLA